MCIYMYIYVYDSIRDNKYISGQKYCLFLLNQKYIRYTFFIVKLHGESISDIKNAPNFSDIPIFLPYILW